MRISDWSSDVCSSDLEGKRHGDPQAAAQRTAGEHGFPGHIDLGAGPGRMVPESASRLRECGAAGRSCKKLDAEFRLDPEEPPADDRLGDAAPTRRGDRKSVVEGKSVSVR